MHVRTKRHQEFWREVWKKIAPCSWYPERDKTAFFAVSQQNKEYYVSFWQKNKFEHRNGYYGKK